MVRTHSLYILLLVTSLVLGGQPAYAASGVIDCFNPGSSVEAAVCGDPELMKSYKLTEEAYQRVQSNPVALGIYIDLLHARVRCVNRLARSPYKLCIIKREFEAFDAFNKLQPGPPPPKVGHGALGQAV